MNDWPIGAKANWPNEDAAVATPKIRLRFSCGTLRPKAAMTMEKDEVAMPTPVMTPADRLSSVPEGEMTISARPSA